MNSEIIINVPEQATLWAEQFKADSTFTVSDVEELKDHLIDLTEDLIEAGLNEEEAFRIASTRLGDISILKNEFEEVNSPVIQMRKTILVLSGVLTFFLLYFFMISSTRLLVLVLHQLKEDPVWNFGLVFSYVTTFHLFIIAFTLFFYFYGKKGVTKLERLKIKPRHTFLLFSGIIILASIDLWFRELIRAFEFSNYTSHLYSLFDYLGYTFPLVVIICFIVLYKKYYLTTIHNEANTGLSTELMPIDTPVELSANVIGDEQLKNRLDLHLKELKKIGLNDEEAFEIAKMRIGMYPRQNKNYITANSQGRSMHSLLIILSGVLVYFFLYFLLHSSARILFTVLQHYENDPVLNIRRTWSYVMFYQWLFILFTAGVYFLDKNIVQRIKRLHIKPLHTLWMLFATIFLAILYRCFLIISKYSISSDFEMKTKLYKIFLYSDFTFPFILCACFLALFYKYYRDNVRIGN